MDEFLRKWNDREEVQVPVEPVVGIGATLYGYSDSYACTIIKVLNKGKKLILQKDKATLLNGVVSGEADALKKNDAGFVSGIQRYKIEPDATGETIVVTLRQTKNGNIWKQLGTKVGQVPGTVSLGERLHHIDINFLLR